MNSFWKIQFGNSKKLKKHLNDIKNIIDFDQ